LLRLTVGGQAYVFSALEEYFFSIVVSLFLVDTPK
jgi:hypothetical protein